jgi:hypothetical protein
MTLRVPASAMHDGSMKSPRPSDGNHVAGSLGLMKSKRPEFRALPTEFGFFADLFYLAGSKENDEAGS